jgi:hypothetical protein
MIPLYDPFDASGNLLSDQSKRQPLQCNGVLNVICPSRIDPVSKRLVGLVGQPDNPNAITNNTRSYRYSQSKTTLPSIKGDYVFNEKSRMSFLYSRYFSPAQANVSQWPGTVPSDGWNTDVKIQYYRLNYDYILRPNLLNHITLGFNKRNLIENPGNVNNISEDVRKAMDFPGVLTPSVAGKTVKYNANYVTFGTHVATDSRQRTVDFKEQLAWIKGRHSVKFGFSYLKGMYRRLLQRCLRRSQLLGFGHFEYVVVRWAAGFRLGRLPAWRFERRRFPLPGRHRIFLALLRVVRAG